MASSESTVKRGGYSGPTGYVFELTGGNIALDFANTKENRPTPDVHDLLESYERLLEWSVQAGVFDEARSALLRAEARQRPQEATAILGRARSLREAIFAIFSAVALGRAAPPAALATLNEALPDALGTLRVTASGSRFAWAWDKGALELGHMLRPVAREAAQLLVSGDVGRVRQCDSSTCDWLFLDRSKNGTRRWCDMSVCGNREKARRHYRRAKAGGARRETPGS